MTPTANWAERLHELLVELTQADESQQDRLTAAAWPVLRTAVLIRARMYASRHGSVREEHLQDLASEKALDLLRRIVSGRWDISGHTAGELASFLSTAARNALVDLWRKEGRLVHPEADPEGPGWDSPRLRGRASVAAHLEPAGLKTEREQYASALLGCVDTLTETAKTVWYLRVMLEMPSRDIATHPDVDKTPGNVDVILQRCRQSVGECMRTKGYRPDEMPQGTFAEIWERFGSRLRSFLERVSNE